MKRLQKLIEDMQDKAASLCESVTKELGLQLLADAKRLTPVGIYPHRVGGTLRRGWKASKVIKHSNGNYQLIVSNSVYYAKFVEYGHLTSSHTRFVPGRHMITRATLNLNQNKDRIIDRCINSFLQSF